jgi:phosphoribosyl-ATP pyrophosphohydrolase/phosphoribosyl-AMP cyclohydrolase
VTSRDPQFGDGLIPAVIQSSIDGQVRMVGMMNNEAWEATRSTGFVHFWSRSRSELWKKGATSGNPLTVRSIAFDCDGDAVLIVAEPY